jgi:hypothetical protein
MSFDARQKNFITIPVDINPTVMPQITIGGWFNAGPSEPAAPGHYALLSHGNGNGGFDRGLIIHKRRGDGAFLWNTFTFSIPFGDATVKAGQWTFVVMRHDQATSNLTFDVDGRQAKTKAFFGLGKPRTTIGHNPEHQQPFSGKIDNIFIYKGVLDDDKIADIRARGEAAILSTIEPTK